MPLSLRRGRVTAVVERVEGLVRVEVDGVPCVVYPQLTGPVALDDDVVVNVQARLLDLGTGGFDVLYANLSRGLGLDAERDAHVMKLPYTPLQFAVRHAEEDGGGDRLDGMPVIGCSLHSQVAPVCAALAGARVAYVQIPGGALPLWLSDTLRALRARGLVDGTASVGPCFGGDAECVTVYAALQWAKSSGAAVAVCALGPGIVGTASQFGHGAMSVAEALRAAEHLGGTPIVALRVSDADERARHRGVSHHMNAIAAASPPSVELALPEGVDFSHPLAQRAERVDVSGWRAACEGLPLSHMGRGVDADPAFFAAAFAAGRLARGRL